jgi:hypothetical protein
MVSQFSSDCSSHIATMASSGAGPAKRSASDDEVDAAQRKKNKQSRVLSVLSTADLAKV